MSFYPQDGVIETDSPSLPRSLKELARSNPASAQSAFEGLTEELALLIEELLMDPASVAALLACAQLRRSEEPPATWPLSFNVSFRQFIDRSVLSWCDACMAIVIFWPDGAMSDWPGRGLHNCAVKPASVQGPRMVEL